MPPDAVVQSRQSLVVSLGRKQERRVGSDVKRIALQAVEGFVHTGSLTAQVTQRRTQQNRNRYHRRRRPAEPESPALALFVRRNRKGGNFRDDRNRQQLLQFL